MTFPSGVFDSADAALSYIQQEYAAGRTIPASFYETAVNALSGASLATGASTSLFYSGSAGAISPGGLSSGVVFSELSAGGGGTGIGQTEVGKFLDNLQRTDLDYLKALQYTLDSGQQVFGRDTARALFDFSGPMWGAASLNFSNSAVGDVVVVLPSDYTSWDSVFWKTELPALLGNQNVTSINGISTSDLRKIANPAALVSELQRGMGDSVTRVAGVALGEGNISRDGYLGHVDKWRSQRRIDVMSMKPRKLSAVLS